MKYVYFLFSSIIIITLFTGCAGNKDLQERAPANLQPAYAVVTEDGTELYIPVASIQTNLVSLDSVYYKGRKAALRKSDEREGLYVAKFNKKGDMIMSSNPADEYGNKAPILDKKMDFDLKDDEAVLIFIQNGKTKYYKISGITQKS